MDFFRSKISFSKIFTCILYVPYITYDTNQNEKGNSKFLSFILAITGFFYNTSIRWARHMESSSVFANTANNLGRFSHYILHRGFHCNNLILRQRGSANSWSILVGVNFFERFHKLFCSKSRYGTIFRLQSFGRAKYSQRNCCWLSIEIENLHKQCSIG